MAMKFDDLSYNFASETNSLRGLAHATSTALQPGNAGPVQGNMTIWFSVEAGDPSQTKARLKAAVSHLLTEAFEAIQAEM